MLALSEDVFDGAREAVGAVPQVKVHVVAMMIASGMHGLEIMPIVFATVEQWNHMVNIELVDSFSHRQSAEIAFRAMLFKQFADDIVSVFSVHGFVLVSGGFLRGHQSLRTDPKNKKV